MSEAPFEQACDRFRERFGRAPEVWARAPGRVNLIGEHTDYNEGWVLPCAIDRETRIVAAPRSDTGVRVGSQAMGEIESFELEELARRGTWGDHVRGIAYSLVAGGKTLRGIDAWIESTLPAESGLSSSAALGVALAHVFDCIQSFALSALDIARIAQRAENDFIGVRCGIMDQLTSACGRRDRALHIDCRSLELEFIPFPSDALGLLVAHSGVERALVDGGYGDRRAECSAAFEALRAAGIGGPQARALRDFAMSDLEAIEGVLDPVAFRRTRHVVSENARVAAACDALSRSDFDALGELLRQGMRSLREDFEVSIPELDALCSIADRHPAVFGSRLTGAGFGGCTLHLVAAAAKEDAMEHIRQGFAKRFGRVPRIFDVVAAPGASAGAF